MKRILVLIIIIQSIFLISCAKQFNRFYIQFFGQDGSNSFITGDNTYLDSAWSYNEFKNQFHRGDRISPIETRDLGITDFPCTRQSIFYDVEVDKK